ncbi:hypothetical protein BC937DRAFT_93135, partial [Endogone sp. FLAS-F59071]
VVIIYITCALFFFFIRPCANRLWPATEYGLQPSMEFKINKDFAKKYEKQKQAEELTKLKEKYGDQVSEYDEERLNKITERKHKWGIRDDEPASTFLLEDDEDDEDDEEEDETAEMLTPEVDAQILKTIAAIRSKDARVYDPQQRFFSEEEIAKAREKWKEKQSRQKSQKPVTLKDYQRKVLLENGGYIEDEDQVPSAKKMQKTHVEEQEEMKNAFKNVAVDDNDEDDDFLVKRTKSGAELEAEEDDYKKFLLESIAVGWLALVTDADNKAGAEAFQDWQNYKDNPKVDKEEAFLIEYILNRGWIDKSVGHNPTYNDIVDDVEPDEDEEAIEAADRFESRYNFRYEEEGAEQLVTHARDIEGSVRHQDDRRKKAREAKEERRKEEKLRKMEELKRLKNLKMKEIYDRLKQIQEITGNTSIGVDDVDLEGDFDPIKYDEKMSKAFGDGYYDDADNKKPQWDDDIDIGDIIRSEVSDGETRAKKKGEQTKQDKDEEEGEYDEEEGGYDEKDGAYSEAGGGGGDDEDFIMDADYLPGGDKYDPNKGKKGKKNKNAQEAVSDSKKSQKKEFERYLEEYYQLDYEDMIGDLPTRFKYQQVKPMSFGLSPVEILLAEDEDLNQVISLKKLAP